MAHIYTRRQPLPIARGFVAARGSVAKGASGRWSAAPDDLDLKELNKAMESVATAYDLFDKHDAAQAVIDPRNASLEHSESGLMGPGFLIGLDPEIVYPAASNGRLQKIAADQVRFVRDAIRTEGLSEADIPASYDDARESGRHDLVLPRWMLDPAKIDAIEKSIRQRAYHGLPELKKLHDAETGTAEGNTAIFLETGWHPTQRELPMPRSVRDSSELRRIIARMEKGRRDMEDIVPHELVDQFVLPAAVLDMNCWENSSLTVPWASPDGFFDRDERRDIDPEDVDAIWHEVDQWLVSGKPPESDPSRRGTNNLAEGIVWKMKNRDGLYGGIYKHKGPIFGFGGEWAHPMERKPKVLVEDEE